MNYARAIVLRHRALRDCQAARAELDVATGDAMRAYQAHPLPVLTGAVGVGIALSQLRVGRGVVHGAMRLASGPGWRLVQQLLRNAG